MQKFSTYKEITPAQIEGWKKKNKKLFEVQYKIDEADLKLDAPSAKFVICEPSRDVLRAVAKNRDDIGKANDLLIINCVLGGDMKYLDENEGETDIYLSVLESVSKLIKSKKETIKKL